MNRQLNIFIRILIPFCLGIWILRKNTFTELNSVSVEILVFSFILLFIISHIYNSIKVYNHKIILGVLMNLFFVISGLFCCKAHDEFLANNHFSKHPVQYLKITVADEPQQRGSLLRFKARVICGYSGTKRVVLTGSLMTAIKSDTSDFSLQKTTSPLPVTYGKTYLIPARFSPVAPPYNPHEFDLKFWLSNHNIYHQAFLYPDELSPTPEQHGNPMVRYALALRKHQIGYYRKLIRDDEAFAVASTLILGYRADLDPATLTAYSNTGTIHALSVSGMHVGIIYLVLEWALRWMNRKNTWKLIKICLVIFLIWAYTILTGYSASVLRSAIMLTLFMLTKYMNKNTLSYHSLYCSAFCLLVYDPFLLWDAGFQLSYLAVMGLFWLHPKIEQLISFKKYWLKKTWSLVSLSLAAQTFTTPLSVYYFHQFPVYFILSNLFIALPVTVIMYLGILILLLHADYLAIPFEWLITFMNRGLSWISGLPHSTILSICINQTELALLCLFLLLLLAGLSSKNKKMIFASLVFLLGLEGSIAKEKLVHSRQKMILMFSLDKGYAVAFISAEKTVVVTDLLPASLAFKFHLKPALDQLQVKVINCIPWGREIHSPELKVKDHQLHFRSYRILLADTSFNEKKIKGRPHFDAIWLHNSPKIAIEDLKDQVTVKKIWVDASNKGYVIQKFLKDTINFRSTIVLLKKNNSSLINLK